MLRCGKLAPVSFAGLNKMRRSVTLEKYVGLSPMNMRRQRPNLRSPWSEAISDLRLCRDKAAEQKETGMLRPSHGAYALGMAGDLDLAKKEQG